MDPTRSSQPEPDTQVSRCLWFPPKGSRGHFRPIRGARCVSPWLTREPFFASFHHFKPHANQYWYLPYPAYGYAWVVLWLLFFRSVSYCRTANFRVQEIFANFANFTKFEEISCTLILPEYSREVALSPGFYGMKIRQF